MLLLAIGFGAGLFLDRKSQPAPELASLHKEVADMRQLLVISMLQQTSAASRLEGVSYSYQLQQADPEIISALIHSLKSDNSVDVRLAALDSLRRYEQDKRVREGLTDALHPKQSPLVQIELIKALVEMRDRDAVNKFQEIEKSPDVNPAVKEKAKFAIQALSRG
jgi:HEAT repeat protein